MLKPAIDEVTNVNASIENIVIGANKRLSLEDAYRLSRQSVTVNISSDSYTAIDKCFNFLKSQIASRVTVYGINTNFGDQVTYIDPHLTSSDELYYQSINKRQENIIKSLSCGLGMEVDPSIVKVTMMLRAHCLAQGYSGVHPNTVETLLSHLNADIIPIVHQYGSIGASGDLIPLGNIAASALGLDVEVACQGVRMPASQAIQHAGIPKLCPQLRDGLGLVNGTSFMTAISSLAMYDLRRLFNQMLMAMGMSLEAMQVKTSAYHPLTHQLKGHIGEMKVAEFLMEFWSDSQLVVNTIEAGTSASSVHRVQDYYSLRAIAQGFGPFYENLHQAVKWVENEMNSVNDNPIIDTDNSAILHSANFMGYYITDACDLLKIDIAQASSWLHALLANMVHARKNKNLPTNIVEFPETNNGFRSMQLLSAAITVQNRKLAQSHQSFMIPTEGDNQDVNSLGTHAAFDLREAVANLERLTAILFLASVQALEMRGIENASAQSRHIYRIIRDASPTLTECRPMAEEINAIITLLKDELI